LTSFQASTGAKETKIDQSFFLGRVTARVATIQNQDSGKKYKKILHLPLLDCTDLDFLWKTN
jgi:hypothetical protein